MTTIWVLTRKESLRTHQAKRLEYEAEKRGIRLKHVYAAQFEILEPGKDASKIRRSKKNVRLPDCVFTRMTAPNYFELALLRHFDTNGVMLFNEPDAIIAADDKLLTIQKLVKSQIAIPRSILAKFPVDYDFVEQQIGFPLILKTIYGAKGEGVLLLDNRKQLEDVMTVLLSMTEGRVSLIFQKFMHKSYGKDIRIVVVDNQAVGAVLRQGGEGNFKANVSAGGQAHQVDLTDELEELAVAATRAIGLDVSGVDLLFSEDGYVVGEVNATPGFFNYEEVSGANVAGAIVDAIVERLAVRKERVSLSLEKPSRSATESFMSLQIARR